MSFHDEKVGARTFRDQHLPEVDNVGMPETLKELDLSHGGDREAVFLGLHTNALECDERACLDVARFVDFAVGALADLDESFVEFCWRCYCCGWR